VINRRFPYGSLLRLSPLTGSSFGACLRLRRLRMPPRLVVGRAGVYKAPGTTFTAAC